MATDRYTQTDESGSWAMLPDKRIVWRTVKTTRKFDAIMHSWYPDKTETIEVTPELSPFKLTKEAVADVLLFREKTDDDTFETKMLIFHRKVAIKVKEDYQHIYLTLGDDKRYYVKDLLNMSTYRFDLSNQDTYCRAKQLSQKRITKDEAMLVDTGYLISKETDDGNDGKLGGVYVKPSP